MPHPQGQFGPATYGDSFADVYDDWYDDVSDAEATARFVDRFGAAQTVVEFGVGTGRLARAIQAGGHNVVGVDSSRRMLEQLDPEVAGPAVCASMTDVPLRGGWADLVIVATNTLFNLDTVESQQRAFEAARDLLRLGGRFVVEAVRPTTPSDHDHPLTVRSVDVDRVVLTATAEHAGVITGQHIEITESGIRLRPWRIRMSDIDALDEMAVRARFRLGDRYASWEGESWDPDARAAVSVYVAV